MTLAISPSALRELLFSATEFALLDVRAYLNWEVALVEQIKRDPTIRFRAYD